MSTELGDGLVGTRATVSLKDVRVLDIISRVENRGNGNGSNLGRLVGRSRSPGIHILIATKHVNYFPTNGEVERGAAAGAAAWFCASGWRCKTGDNFVDLTSKR